MPGSLAFGTVLEGLSARVSCTQPTRDSHVGSSNHASASELRGCPLFMDHIERKIAFHQGERPMWGSTLGVPNKAVSSTSVQSCPLTS